MLMTVIACVGDTETTYKKLSGFGHCNNHECKIQMFVTVDGRWQVYYLAVMCSQTRLDQLASLPNVVRMLARTHEFFGSSAMHHSTGSRDITAVLCTATL